ncbi:putative transcription factor HSF-type-DNA-binding family [Helianthus annuus]|uniref:Putative winged helix-turn-helix DNA-binding domain, Heat shock transcription factor family n=1 Tax=Helianthus annuus TaxID=4232 RepID=A0A251TZI7_HELAN|nr:heat stress transcription factor B-4 [Helianthus annuus]KAF5792313.1 putative transcription factor HSF-type-DNA-binding family [Helianthus annuus]KAJ0527269.1 putative transcription factor HSF-type-DNA-binding family [Helianthus annuus]KAJ0535944.1 putative transcription factor HSF-type-DNA-binding family [Helianthus annuus]KAJ0543672.1 putative transcription factor HSF-type-DNA-binding family [Helianthus annuus]KAJ0708727.1 putative transcription factor HSF-type-DNA-binding family [Heliant
MALMIDNSCEGILLSLDSHKSMPAPFLTKTYQLVDDSTTDHIVSWGEDDTTFVVWRPPEFARDLLPNYFKHNNFSSFVRQLNTYGFRKIVPDRWEFANEFFKKGEKHLLCEIHRRKTSQQPHVGLNHNHFTGISGGGGGGNGFFSYPSTRDSISPPNSDDHLCCDSPPPLSSPTTTTGAGSILGILLNNNSSTCFSSNNRTNSVTELSKDNERLRRSNNMLMSELAHMRKLYNDVIYFVQNHVKPVTPSNSYPSSLVPLLVENKQQKTSLFNAGSNTNATVVYSSQPQQLKFHESTRDLETRTKLFGVPLLSKKRLHPDYGSGNTVVELETHKARLILEKDDLGLKLMPPSPC